MTHQFYCKKCILPSTRPNLGLDKQGNCYCSTKTLKDQVNWEERRGEFEQVVTRVKKMNRAYDCVIPVSGGKDSTWQVLTAIDYGLNPLAVTWRTPKRNSIGYHNLENLKQIGCDHIDFSVNPTVDRKFVLSSFKKYGTPAIPMHMAIHAIPARFALEKKIPLIIWGENSAVEYGSQYAKDRGRKINSEWVSRFGVTHGTVADDWIGVDGLTSRDLQAFNRPSDRELTDAEVEGIFLGEFFRWDPFETFKEVSLKTNFKSARKPKTGLYNFADIDEDFLMTIHHWFKWLKFGFTRTWDNLSIEIRAERISREDALQVLMEIGDETPLEEIDQFCKHYQMPLTEFKEIADRFRNRNIWYQENGKWKLRNFPIKNWNWK